MTQTFFVKLTRLALSTLVLLYGLTVISMAKAEELTTLPGLHSMSAEEFVKHTEVVRKDFEDDQFITLEYQIHKDWTETDFIKLKNIVRERRLYGTIVEYLGPILDNIQPYFKVTTHEMDREISAKNWFINHVLNNGYTLKSFEFDEERGRFEVFYVIRDNLDSYAVRATGIKMGPRIILAEYAVPGRHWKDYRDFQTLVIKSVKFGGYDSDNIEKRNYFAYLEDIGFEYPESWRVFPEIKYGPNKLRVDLINSIDGMAAIGNIRVHLISSKSLESLDNKRIYDINVQEDVKDILAQFTEDYNKHNLIEKRTYDVASNVKFQATDVYELSRNETEYETFDEVVITDELWFSIFSRSYNYYVVTMITPSRERQSYNWAINAEAFKIVVESLMSKKVIEDNTTVEPDLF